MFDLSAVCTDADMFALLSQQVAGSAHTTWALPPPVADVQHGFRPEGLVLLVPGWKLQHGTCTTGAAREGQALPGGGGGL